MLRFDTFWTMRYRGEYIHGKHDRLLRCEVVTTSINRQEHRSLRAAQLAITQHLKRKG